MTLRPEAARRRPDSELASLGSSQDYSLQMGTSPMMSNSGFGGGGHQLPFASQEYYGPGSTPTPTSSAQGGDDAQQADVDSQQTDVDGDDVDSAAAAFLVDPSDAVAGGDGDADVDDGGDEALLEGVEDVGGN